MPISCFCLIVAGRTGRLWTGSDLIVDIKRRYVSEGLESALGMKMEAPAEPAWSETICTWGVGSTPQDFGYFRTRWSCEIHPIVSGDRLKIRGCIRASSLRIHRAFEVRADYEAERSASGRFEIGRAHV